MEYSLKSYHWFQKSRVIRSDVEMIIEPVCEIFLRVFHFKMREEKFLINKTSEEQGTWQQGFWYFFFIHE